MPFVHEELFRKVLQVLDRQATQACVLHRVRFVEVECGLLLSQEPFNGHLLPWSVPKLLVVIGAHTCGRSSPSPCRQYVCLSRVRAEAETEHRVLLSGTGRWR
jgi:hypothetical protein